LKNNQQERVKHVTKAVAINQIYMKTTNLIFILFILLVNGCKGQKPLTVVSEKTNPTQIPEILLLENLYEKDNIVISPISVSSAISMLYLGSSGSTQTEMERVFGFDDNTNKFHQTKGDNIRQIETDNENAVVNIANGLWIERNFDVKQTFISDLQRYYNANLSAVGFQESVERQEANQEINQWISNETNNKIRNLIPLSAITPLTRLILVNAVYFKAGWKFAFNPKQNTREKFATSTGQFKDVNFMNQKKHLKLIKKGDYKCLELPYDNDQYSMVFLLPNENEGMQTIFSAIHSGIVDSLIKQDPMYVHLKVPKFKIEYKMLLNKPLQEMGMTNPFSNDANFQNITGRNNLKLTDVFHGAYIEIDEKGTEAAGATAAVIGIKSAPLNKPVDFYLDRPFVFMIYDKKVKEILFAGICTDPA
jgi:serine protease inhibitor